MRRNTARACANTKHYFLITGTKATKSQKRDYVNRYTVQPTSFTSPAAIYPRVGVLGDFSSPFGAGTLQIMSLFRCKEDCLQYSPFTAYYRRSNICHVALQKSAKGYDVLCTKDVFKVSPKTLIYWNSN